MSDERQRDTDMQRSGEGGRSGDSEPDFEGHRDIGRDGGDSQRDGGDSQDIGRDVDYRDTDV
jgi:general stress protein YciG